MLITRKSIFAVLIALFVLAGFGIASAAVVGGLADNTGLTTLPPTLNNYIAPTGVGDTLIYNYYNVDGNVTYFTVVNTDSKNGIRARIRFKEAADINGACSGSVEVLDFDICLSANDMWTGVIKRNPNDANGGAMLCSPDTDTLVSDLATPTPHSDIFMKIPAALANGGCVPFKYGGQNINPNVTALNTREGYFTIIGQRTIEAEPASCVPDADTNVGAPTNSLFGNAAVINAAPTGSTFTYDATAIANFAGGDLLANVPAGRGTSYPDLGDGQDTINGVNYILTKNMLYSIFDLSGVTSTEFVVTLPTKALTDAKCTGLFGDDRVTYQFFNDAEQPTTGSGCEFSPCPQQQEDSLPYEVNVIRPKQGVGIMTTQVEVLPLVESAYNFGWFVLDLNPDLSAGPNGAITPAHATGYPVPAFSTAYGWPALGLTLLDVSEITANSGAFAMPYSVDVR